jgi:uncharacterized protein YyaL (SSP411 family)
MIKPKLIPILTYFILIMIFISCNDNDPKSVNIDSELNENLNEINWEEFGKPLFEKAKAENKFVILDLKANWCHWCHVMDDSTYANQKVIQKLSGSFLMTKADQDSNPELASRYKKYGWPATIIFGPNGEELIKRAGYIKPQEFIQILNDVENGIYDNEKKTKTYLNESPEKLLLSRYLNRLDYEDGGAESAMKFIDYDDFEYAFLNRTDSLNLWINTSIKGAYNLVDQEFGGVYQYSTHGDWQHQHYEKLLARQARYIKIFSKDFELNKNYKSLEQALKIYSYSEEFLKGKNSHLYYSAQDADLIKGVHSEEYYELTRAERLKQGVPRIDKNTYTNSNAEMIVALISLWSVTDDAKYLNQAEQVFNFLETNRKFRTGLYKHGDEEQSSFAIDDNLKMLSALFALGNATQKNIYEVKAEKLLSTIIDLYLVENGLVKSFIVENGLPELPIVSENLEFVRLANFGSHLFNNPEFYKVAKKAHLQLIEKVKQGEIYNEVALLNNANELEDEPLHCVIFYSDDKFKNDAINASMTFSPFFLWVESYQLQNIPLEVAKRYGDVDKNMVFFCTSNTCSAPFYNSQQIEDYIKKL